MLTRKSSLASGVQVRRLGWGVIAEGTRDMLVHHKFAQDGLFPGDPGANKYSAKSQDPEGRPIRLKRKSKHLFVVWRDWTPDEKAAHAQQMEREREVEDAKRRVDLWPTSANKYRETVRYPFQYASGMLDNVFCSGKLGGYRYDDAAMDALHNRCVFTKSAKQQDGHRSDRHPIV